MRASPPPVPSAWAPSRSRRSGRKRARASVLLALFDVEVEALAVWLELPVHRLDVLADDVGGVGELAVAVALVVLQIIAHRRIGFRRERHAVLLIEAADGRDL